MKCSYPLKVAALDLTRESRIDVSSIQVSLTLHTDTEPSAVVQSYITVEAYKAQLEDELSFSKDTTVEVIKKSVTGWWTIRYTLHYILYASTVAIQCNEL